MRVRIQHRTVYGYDAPTALGPHTLRLHPAPNLRARVETYSLTVTPAGSRRAQLDAWANRLVEVRFDDDNPVTELVIQVDAAFELIPFNPFDFFVDARCERAPFDYPDDLGAELRPFLSDAIDPQVVAFVADLPRDVYVIDLLVALNRKVTEEIAYILRDDPGVQTPVETLTLARGSCRDSAWLIVHAARALGFAARFVSGYLIQLEDEGELPGEPRGMDRDVVDLHAWAEVYVPGAGWIGLDGTSGLLCTEGHIPLATATEPALAAPIVGTADRQADRFTFSQEVERLGHTPRPRRPYTDAQWQALLDAGEAVDDRLEAAGVALTTGGEPTWTSREHPRDPVWLTDALGPTKRAQGVRFAAGIHARMAPGGIILERMGKQYPGESLPRWALDVLWRHDGVPLWRDRARLALATSGPVPATHEHARTFAVAVNKALGVDLEPVAAFEDPWFAIRTEADLPTDVDPTTATVDDPETRHRLARMLTRGLSTPVGWVTPIQPWQGRWRAQRWPLRRGRLFLVPGDSPVGLRLPLDRLPGPPAWLDTEDPWSPRPPLPREVHQAPGGAAAAPDPGGEVASVRTALTVEAREGVLHVFLPPLPRLEDFIALVDAVERATADTGMSVRLEGYAPPPDPRLSCVSVTPDPGVLEVNLPVCHRTRDLAETMDTLHRAALEAGLTTERFQLDGRSAGSGGGCHLTLGGPDPSRSVFLTRPDVLASLLRFVQHHPSLSYLFTGLFVGPTSQAPRVDEARRDSLDELELALAQLSRGGDRPAPWFIDRLLRNLLVDVTGNTHRTEICIDKLFNPGSASGRLGILELRAFEMPPNPRMVVAMTWLLRALVATFVERPYDLPLIDHGRRLHDRFLLPFALWEDLQDVLAHLDRAGVPADPQWFTPFVACRFPEIGRVQAGPVTLTVRPALQPWPVLGEESTGATTSRFVDSSLERIEVTARGVDPSRHVLAVNGWRLPLHATRDPEVVAAGITFRAWQPPHCLHPHLGIHHPLRIDVIDAGQARALGAATYHAWHPEGRAFDEPPLTAFEAASRRATRLTTDGHAPFPALWREAPARARRGVTLDLRWTLEDRPMPWVDAD